MADEIYTFDGKRVTIKPKGDHYEVFDDFGCYIGRTEKDFFGKDQTIFDSDGNKVGRIEKSFFGEQEVFDAGHEKVGKVKSSGSFGGGGSLDFGEGGWVILVAIGVIILLGVVAFRQIPQYLSEAFIDVDFLSGGFLMIALPLYTVLVLNIICIIRKKFFWTKDLGYGRTLLSEFLAVGISFVGYGAALTMISTIEEIVNKGFWDGIWYIFGIILFALYLPAYVIVAVPFAFIISIFAKNIPGK